ncbi:MAG: KilA-N domain-containing protein, partial [bacterium]
MSNLSVFDFNSNNIRFENREGRVWVCLTDMAKASGKQLGHWNTLKSTTEFLTVFESVIGIPITETVQGGQPTLQGTWAIEEVALEFAGWCSVKFKIWMLQQIKTLVTTGTVSLPQVVQPKLTSRQVAVETAKAVAEIEGLISRNNPRLAQFLIDHAISDSIPNQNLLASESLQGVVEIAEEMGMKVNMSNRSQLGKFVKARCGELSQQEKRLVNGTMREVACYPVNNLEVRQAIQDFFA